MQVQTTPRAEPLLASHSRPADAWPALPPARRVLTVQIRGYRVPQDQFVGRVHSAFARACNLTCHDALLTVGTSGCGDGPTILRLADASVIDLREWFQVGEAVACANGLIRTRRVELRLALAGIWRPQPCHVRQAPAQIAAHLRRIAGKLQAHGCGAKSVIHNQGATVVASLGDACRALNSDQAAQLADRLIGWGEGLTPAGDDFLIGLLAALHPLRRGDALRHHFHQQLAGFIAARTSRTSPIAAHYLRLAAAGHHSAALVDLRHALLEQDSAAVVNAALNAALDIGATSGADTVSGLLAGLAAWLPETDTAAPAAATAPAAVH